MSLFRYLWRTSRRGFLLAVAASVVSGGTGAGFIALVNTALRRHDVLSAGLVWTYVGLCVITIITRAVSQILLFQLSQSAIYQLRRQLIDGILDAPLRGVEQIGTPRLYSALSDDVVVIADALPGLPALCSSVAFVAVCLVYLVTLSNLVTIGALGAIAVGVGLYALFSRYGMRSLATARTEQDQLFLHFRGLTEGIKELKLNRQRREALAGHEFDDTATSYRRHSVLGLSVFEGAAGTGQAVFFAFIGVLLFTLPGHASLSAQTLSACVLTVLFAVNSLQSVLTWIPVLGRASVALNTIQQRLGLLRAAGVEQQGSAGSFADWNRIDLRGVAHRYPGPAGEQFLLGPLDLQLRRGEVLFVVGANGSGKTTLAKLVTSLYRPEAGSVWVDDVEVTGRNVEAYRQLFSAVFSDFFLFDGLLGLTGADRDARAVQYLDRLQLAHKVHIDQGRFSTTALSQGQRKRLALLVSRLEDRCCYVFDEWAADQDPVFKEFFYSELLPDLKAQGKAVLVISHDDRYFGAADRLIRLENGQLRQDRLDNAQVVMASPALLAGTAFTDLAGPDRIPAAQHEGSRGKA